MLSIALLQDAGDSIGWIWYLLIVFGVLALMIGWIFQQSKKRSKEQKKQADSKASDKSKLERRKDDLTVIEGIGPKVASVLKDAGITDFDSLSGADPAEVKTVLNKAGLQMMDPEGWIEQAEYAANEAWDGLQKLQDELKGGRRMAGQPPKRSGRKFPTS